MNTNRFLENEIDPAFRKRAELILQNLYSGGNIQILDVGCGRGFYTNTIGRLLPKSEVWGVDKSKNYLKQAGQSRVRNVRYVQAKAEALPFANGKFDAVICSELLEHADNDMKVMAEINRVAKKGAIAMISVPNANYPFLWDPINWLSERLLGTHISKEKWWIAGIWADHVRLYQEEEIRHKLERAGWKIGAIWRVVRWCLPFSHLMLYGIGKNIVEKGWMPTANRFNYSQELTFTTRLVKKFMNSVDWLNDIFGPTAKTSYQGMVIRAVKK
jgi:ubiquinone/menaquinone biosynthesis C-methylase UbiE